MKGLVLAVLLISGVCVAEAGRTYWIPEGVDMMELRKKLDQQSFSIQSFGADAGKLRVVLSPGETKDPSAIIDSLTPSDDKEARSLVAKLRSGTITAAEKDRLLLLVVDKLFAASK
ncbi:MAG: hypothetical protein HY925_01730 [Elusimicrobia bacterium]|nr:hypothetical protein [Elusimicrobiota bacterium]